MFETFPNPSLEAILITLRAIALIGALWVFALAFIRWRRADERSNQQLHQQLNRAFNEVRSLHETIAVMNARLESLAERADADARLAPAGPIGAQRGYDVAARLAKNGCDIEELVSSCGLTRHEAELLTRLHGRKETAAATQAAARRTAAQTTSEPSWPLPNTTAAQPATASPPSGSGRKRGSLLSVVG